MSTAVNYMYERTQDPNHPRSLRGQSRHRPPREKQLFRNTHSINYP